MDSHEVKVPRVLWVTFDFSLTEEQIKDVAIRTIKKYNLQENGREDHCESVVSVNKYASKHAYLFVSNEEEFNVLSGLNPDGSARIAIVEKELDMSSFSLNSSWADLVDEDEEVEQGPIVEIEECVLTEEQSREFNGRKTSGVNFTQAVIDLESFRSDKELILKIFDDKKNLCIYDPKRIYSEMRRYIRSHNIDTKNYPDISVIYTRNNPAYIVKFEDRCEALVTRLMIKNKILPGKSCEYSLVCSSAPKILAKNADRNKSRRDNDSKRGKYNGKTRGNDRNYERRMNNSRR